MSMQRESHLPARPVGPVTSADVARAAGVSRGAVSQILNGRGDRFAPATRERVLETAARLDYQPSLAGRALARGTSDVVVAVVPYTTFGGHLQDMLDVMTSELARRGFTLVTRFSADDVPAFERFLAALQPAAVLAMAQLDPALHELLAARGIPLVASEGSAPTERAQNSVIGDLQATHLIERGYRRLGYARLTDSRDNVYGDSRVVGFRQACDRAGVDAPVVIDLALDDRDAGQLLRAAGAPGIAFGCYNDDVALALIARACDSGWTVPKDVAVIGVDNSPLSRALTPRLTTIGYDPSAIAQSLVAVTLMSLGVSPEHTPTAPEFFLVPGQTA